MGGRARCRWDAGGLADGTRMALPIWQAFFQIGVLCRGMRFCRRPNKFIKALTVLGFEGGIGDGLRLWYIIGHCPGINLAYD
jgi:hypothetical protein